MLPSFADDVVTLEEPVWINERGKQVATYPGTAAKSVLGCSVQPGSATVDLQARDNVTILYTAFIPAGTPVTRHAKVTLEGDEFAIDGVPLRWKSPLGTVDHIVLPIIAWEG